MGFEKLSQKFKDEVLKPVWAKYAQRVHEEYGYDLATEGLALRNKVQTDGFWLAKNILGYAQFSDCHRELFTDFFVIKDPAAKDFKSFAEADTETHDRLLMLSRGGFKSTADIVDCIQWIVCFPDIRINIMTGTGPLAEEFTGLIKGHFTLDTDPQESMLFGDREGLIRSFDDGRLRLLQVLFPEHCETKPGLNPEWVTPARQRDVAGPTIRATSLDKNTTGTHCDLLKVDDGTNAENTQTPERIKSVNRAITMARRLCEPYGYKDRIGTPYHVNDNLVSTVRDEDKRRENGQPANVKILIHPACVVKPGYEGYTPDEWTDEMVVLWFPERLTLKYLKTEYADALKTDIASFYSQLLLDLSTSNTVKFRRDRMIAATIDKPPQDGMVFQAWDLSYSEKESAKFTVGIAGSFTPQGIFIIDMVRGRFGEYELPGVMAAFAHKWKPRRVAIEDSMGAKWLNPELRREQARLHNNTYFEFVSLGRGTKEKNKENKAKLAVRLLGDGRLYFTKQIDGLTEIYDELEAFPKGKFTDIVCSLSLLCNHFSNYTNTFPTQQPSMSDYMERVQRDRIYGLGRYAPQTFDQTMIAFQQGEQPLDSDPLAAAGLFQ